MVNNRELNIATAGSRKATKWHNQKMYWSDLVDRLRTPAKSTENFSEYLNLPKSKQDDLKDIGGFVGGYLNEGRRKAMNVVNRDIIALDMDNIPSGETNNILCRLNSLGCSYATYSTRKHEENAPRLRVLIPCDRSLGPEEYEPVARKIASLIGIELCDPTTFDVSRLMYWPSCCSDGKYVFVAEDKPFISSDGILAMYQDWHNCMEWPQVPGQEQARQRLIAKQQDPLAKNGVVGAFCKTYSVFDVMDKFLPGTYELVTGSDSRYTYTGGSTIGGALVFDHGKFIYSWHATDPGSGKLLNAFDLLRVHKYGAMDDESKPDTPINKLPSYQAACQYVVADADIANILNSERYNRVTEAFVNANIPDDDTEVDWIKMLEVNPNNGQPAKTIKNVRILLEYDPLIRGRIHFDTFTEYIFGVAPLPWAGRETSDNEVFRWKDEDDAGLRDYIEQVLKFKTKDTIMDALLLTAKKHSVNPLEKHLDNLKWDGIKRLDRLYIDHLGADDSEYTRAVTRKGFVAAIARVKQPGIKFDTMTVINGPQGTGKTTLFERMGMDWFSNSIKTFEGKEASELLQGTWIVEIGEMEAFKKSDMKAVKGFLSKTEDHYRAAYARKTEKHKRKCVFFGTTNDDEYLSDQTGNRRIWPIDTDKSRITKNVFRELTPDVVDQILAEAYVYWQLGEPLILSDELEAEAEKRREAKLEKDPMQGMIEEFIDKQVPADWQKMDINTRMMFWGGNIAGVTGLVDRDRICAIEVWRESMKESRLIIPKADAHRINALLSQIKCLERTGVISFGPYGKQRGFRICKSNSTNQV